MSLEASRKAGPRMTHRHWQAEEVHGTLRGKFLLIVCAAIKMSRMG